MKVIEAILFFCVAVLVFLLYFLPTFTASKRKHKDENFIALVNLLFGWTFLGWIICLVWACNGSTKESSVREDRQLSTTDEIRKLWQLKEDGAITNDEYEKRKKQLI